MKIKKSLAEEIVGELTNWIIVLFLLTGFAAVVYVAVQFCPKWVAVLFDILAFSFVPLYFVEVVLKIIRKRKQKIADKELEGQK